MKKCKICKSEFAPSRPLQSVCGPVCAFELVKKNSAKKLKNEKIKEKKEDKKKLKTRADWMREAQNAFNSWVRERDIGQPCISCGQHHHGVNHAGHYLSVGSRPELRFEPLNVHLQCPRCNLFLSGNLLEYRRGLFARIGLENLEWLEGPHDQKKYLIDELIAIKKYYQDETKRIKK